MTSDIAPFPIQFDVAVGNLDFTLDSGAYYVQTNLGGADRMQIPDPTIGAYRVNAAAAKYSRIIANELYGEHRPYGYLFGGSGGSYQVMGSAEQVQGVWDGFLPYVLGTPYALPSMFTVRLHALRVLRQRNMLPTVMDAVNPGGSGNPYAELDATESAALREASLLGYPLKGWWNHETLDSGYLGYNIPGLMAADPGYADEFWSKPGYLGGDPRDPIHDARIQFETTVAEIVPGRPMKIRFESVPDKDFADSILMILSGESAGGTVPLGPRAENPMSIGFAVDARVIAGIKPGDRVRIDNSFALAAQTYHRHQVPGTTDLYAWNQFRDADGKPIYPQRARLYGPLASGGVSGTALTGNIQGKVLILEVLMDIDALPWQADWYRSMVQRGMKPETGADVAIWFIDNAQHDDPQSVVAHTNTVSFAGALQQGLRDLARWVEAGTRPAETNYKVVDTQVEVAATAIERGGIQAVIDLAANGAIRAEARVGEPVAFTAAVAVPPGQGKIVSVEWDFEGVGDYPSNTPIAIPQEELTFTATHSYSKPGTYFPVVRVASQRDGDMATHHGRVQNIARARVVVTN